MCQRFLERIRQIVFAGRGCRRGLEETPQILAIIQNKDAMLVTSPAIAGPMRSVRMAFT